MRGNRESQNSSKSPGGSKGSKGGDDMEGEIKKMAGGKEGDTGGRGGTG